MNERHEIEQLRREVQDLRDMVKTLLATRNTGDHQLRLAFGVFESAFSVDPSTQTKEYTAVLRNVRLFDSVNQNGLLRKETLTRIAVTVACPGDFERGQLVICFAMPDGTWEGLPAGCDPVMTNYLPTTIPAPS